MLFHKFAFFDKNKPGLAARTTPAVPTASYRDRIVSFHSIRSLLDTLLTRHASAYRLQKRFKSSPMLASIPQPGLMSTCK